MRKPLDSQRKSPQQGRSRALVDAIFEATVRILPAIGSQNVTTKKIADLAGVSIGSLYQYFPNKESLLAGVMDLAMSGTHTRVDQRIDEITGGTLNEMIDRMVDTAVELMLGEKAKVREIYRQAPELGRIPALFRLRQHTVERLASEVERLYPGLTREEYVRVTFVGVNGILGVIHTMLYDEDQHYTNAEIAFDLKAMALGYFRERLAREMQ